MPRKLNMQLVAEAAGVSKSAVSLALRDDPRLAAETRKHIQTVAARMGYRKNPIVATLMAQLRVSQTPRFQANFALINYSTNRIMFDLPNYDDVRRGIRERADEAGYGVEEFWANEPGLKLERLHEILKARGIKGVIIAATPEPSSLFPENPEFLRDFALAAVGIERTQPSLPRASTNRFETAREAVRAALAAGRRRPGMVLFDRHDHLLRRCYSSGFLAAVEDARELVEERISPLLLKTFDDRVFLKWVKATKPDVIITDRMEVREWLAGTKFRVPERVGLIHLNWTTKLRNWAGMDQNSRFVGAAAADLVINQINRSEAGIVGHPKLVLIDSEFVPGPSLPAALTPQ